VLVLGVAARLALTLGLPLRSTLRLTLGPTLGLTLARLAVWPVVLRRLWLGLPLLPGWLLLGLGLLLLDSLVGLLVAPGGLRLFRRGGGWRAWGSAGEGGVFRGAAGRLVLAWRADPRWRPSAGGFGRAAWTSAGLFTERRAAERSGGGATLAFSTCGLKRETRFAWTCPPRWRWSAPRSPI
jgi:hypothetical protein